MKLLQGNVFTPVCQSFCSRGRGVCLIACSDTPPGPKEDTPLDQRQTPPRTKGRHPHPRDQRQTPPPPGTKGRDPWDQRQTPHPLRDQRQKPPGPKAETPWDQRQTPGRRLLLRWYASYWNAFLCFFICTFMMDV